MKKKIFAVSVIAVFMAILASGTIAYFTADETAHNIITSGGIDIDIIEKTEVDGELLPYPDEPIEVMPASQVSKIVSVKSLDNDSWVRVRLDIVITDSNGKKFDLLKEEIERIIKLDISDLWTEKDGYYYYGEKIGGGDETVPLFTTVTFDGPNMTNEYQKCTLEIIVNAEAVQSANNGKTVFEAAGWKKAE